MGAALVTPHAMVRPGPALGPKLFTLRQVGAEDAPYCHECLNTNAVLLELHNFTNSYHADMQQLNC